jgi:hypothetical protein
VVLENYGSLAAGGAVCLLNHFRGRISCPYGQDANSRAPAGASQCVTPEGKAVTGAVRAQCADRRAVDTVHWSCRCANAYARTDDGDAYCTCPSGMTCKPLVSPLGADPEHASGSYCVKTGHEYDPNSACAVSCDPAVQSCN